ncbi:kinase-like protein [Annulohypoxylon maeteangense]|uniref:kinase-like protein n=1 Tax=Annulohypoxylon maeteangense TaxID=1927788 RepID=UPI0020089B51|nr:kinase-like protein [Annulohypoxylon maeteangense]KAI0884229.1 kinase-like protein [Annulohypoxylon maeteangense]
MLSDFILSANLCDIFLQTQALPFKTMDDRREAFGPLVDIPDTSLIALALRVYEYKFLKPSEKCRVIARIAGSYNLVHVAQLDNDFRLVIRVPVTGWGSGKTETAARALESTVATMRFIANHTSIPVPQVYEYDTSDDNEIHTPYMCISFIYGSPVSNIWSKGSDTIPLIHFQHNILRSLAQVMVQFSCFRFNKIGSIPNNDVDAESLEPCYSWQQHPDATLRVVSSGPFDSASSYLAHHYREDDGDEYSRGASAILKSIMSTAIPDYPSEYFVLCPPDFDSQNVLVDRRGNVTGLIDWDHAQTLPQSMGYARFPAWLTRDWDPSTYSWPEMSGTEDSPATLNYYRQQYCQYLGNALKWRREWMFTLKSHMAEAVWIAVHYTHSRVAICQKLIEEVPMGNKYIDGRKILFDIGNDDFEEEDWNSLIAGIKSLFIMRHQLFAHRQQARLSRLMAYPDPGSRRRSFEPSCYHALEPATYN